VPEPGDLIGPYRLISQLGRGAMGEVWRAQDERLDRYVALKVLPPDAAGDFERRARMLREARAAAAIRHANVVTLFDIVSHRGDDILVMELVEGRTLSETLRKEGPPPLETALRWIEEVARALVAAHGRGILHRDIKAANIMIGADGVKVLDFGLAKLRDVDPGASFQHLALGETVRSLPATVPAGKRLAAASAPALSAEAQAAETLPMPGDTMVSSVAATARPAAGGSSPGGGEASYETHAGQLIGTPLYMAPEQVEGSPPDERSEVFSVGVLAYEILSGKLPYTATSVELLFHQIAGDPPPPLEDVPNGIEAIVMRALDKDPARRFPSMSALRDAVIAERKRRFGPGAGRRWPLAVLAAVVVAGAAVGLWLWQRDRAPAALPGDDYVKRALEEYDVFYNDKAASLLRSAVSVAPDHPRANAYMILFGGASDEDVAKAVAAARRTRPSTGERSKDRALLDAAIALGERGPVAARSALATAGAASDRELEFWAAELDYRAGDYPRARDEYRALLADPARTLRGRIYDHYSSVLIYLDEPEEALRVGTLYRDAFPAEADAVGVYATTLAAAGRHEEALAAAREALRLSEGEDTLAGLGKVTALAGDLKQARELYQRSLDRAGMARRPLRRAALALLQWIDGDLAAAKATVAPCIDGASEAQLRERGACLFVAGVIEPERAGELAAQLETLAGDATESRPAHGAPGTLAALVRARATFFGGACVVDPRRPDVRVASPQPDPTAYAGTVDFFAAYHVPFFATWAACERAAALAAIGDRAGARTVIESYTRRAPNRTWLLKAAETYR
jgi:serine/threonine protein kinase/tetratricopeptide (TPR) repeat protein